MIIFLRSASLKINLLDLLTHIHPLPQNQKYKFVFFFRGIFFYIKKRAAVRVWWDTLFLFPFLFVYFDNFDNSVMFLQTNQSHCFVFAWNWKYYLLAWLCRLLTYISYNFQDPSAPVVKSELLIEFYFTPWRGKLSFPLVVRNNDFLVYVIIFFNDFESNFGAYKYSHIYWKTIYFIYLSFEFRIIHT